jgi:hypothetical protein
VPSLVLTDSDILLSFPDTGVDSMALTNLSRSSMIRSMVACGGRVGVVRGRRDCGWKAASPSAR